MLTISTTIVAQNDGFFSYQSYNNSGNRTAAYEIGGNAFEISQMDTEQNLPISNGLLLLVSAGLAYLSLKKKEVAK